MFPNQWVNYKDHFFPDSMGWDHAVEVKRDQSLFFQSV